MKLDDGVLHTSTTSARNQDGGVISSGRHARERNSIHLENRPPEMEAMPGFVFDSLTPAPTPATKSNVMSLC